VQVLRPRDAVQWALYYPPILDLRTESTASLSAGIAQAVGTYRRGNVPEAIAELAGVPADERDGRWAVTQAAMLLTVGQVGAARGALSSVASDDAAYGDALAVESLIALVTGNTDTALDLAREAVTATPASPVPLIARGYAEQARFDIPSARASTLEATRLAPEDPLAWARLAELEQSLGNLGEGRAAAERAESLDPKLSRTQTVLGFARLTQMQADAAAEAFRKAIRLDSADPLPRLGLGLARIRRGNLAEGRGDIEIAASLDPNNSLVRSYLGKAYYEEKREFLAGSELAIAKELDPGDPTPWLYDAIRDETENRPVEALANLQRSIALNDNRGVYRSRLLLDQDLATRNASLGRIYQDLSFDQLALQEAYKSLQADPANFSAHRLLADAYSALPRHELAQASELRQSQLLGPIALQPFQSQLSQANIGILQGAGPPSAGFNEFSRLFVSDGVRGYASGVIGGNDTRGADLSVSGVHGRVGWSLGRFAYETQGFRENNDLKTELNAAFVQFEPSPSTAFQLEVRKLRRQWGDLRLNWDLEQFRNIRNKRDVNQYIAGARFELKPGSQLLFSAGKVNADTSTDFPEFNSINPSHIRSRTAEVQHLASGSNMRSVVGFGRTIQEEILPTGVNPFTGLAPFTLDANHSNFHSYLYAGENSTVRVTLGLAYDKFLNAIQGNVFTADQSKWSPKFGLVAQLDPSTTARFAVFRTVKRPLPSNQTLEPTQVAGFNQLYDDADGTEASRIGIGIDHAFSTKFQVGGEITARQVDEPIFLGFPAIKGFLERTHRAYAYITPSKHVALAAEYIYDDYDARDDLPSPLVNEPTDLITHTVPLTLSLFRGRSDLKVRATYVRQTSDILALQDGTATPEHRDTSFWVTDLEASYRLPKRAGELSLLLKNVFDRSFDYQDRSFQETSLGISRVGSPLFIPERIVLARLVLNF
jgi:tetratricopeptide (TPR) repeat protein